MDQSSPTRSINAPAQENGDSTMAVNSIHQLKRLLQNLDGLPNKPPSIYLDASGVGRNELINLQLLVPPTNTLYVVNMRRLGMAALSAVGDSSASLRLILESRTITKVGFDIRDMSRLLFSQLNVSLGGMYDLQLMELASRDEGQSKKFLAGVAKCVEQDIPSSSAVKRRWLQPDDSTNMHQFNSLGHVPWQSMRRVELFPTFWMIYRRKLSVPSKAFWLSSARAESQQRVEDSKGSTGRQARQQLGPEVWWDHEQRQAAIDFWNDDLLMETRVGDMELNDDAEWVSTHKEGDWIFDLR